MDNFDNNEINNDNLPNSKNDNELNDKVILSNPSFSTDHTTDYSKINKNNEKGFMGKKIMSYIAVGLICTVVSASVSTVASLYLIPKTNLFKNTPLYESLANNKTYTTSTNSANFKASPVSTNVGALSVVDIAKKVGPAVVGVSTKSLSQADMYGIPEASQEGMGSGIIFNKDGYILTNYHVINGATQIKVILTNNKEVNAKVINYDSSLDIAVIKVTDNVTMPGVAEFGNSKDLQVGDPVVAIGNPLGKELLGSVTTGIISATNREIAVENSKQTLLQTDAAINPGNSGGPLVNALGQVIGVNSSKMGGAGIEGLGFSIPIDVVKPKIDSLLKPILKIGIAGRDIDKAMSSQYNIPQGVYVAQVEQFSAAERAGLQVGDVITKVDGKAIASVDDLNKIKSQHKSGDDLSIEVSRNNATKTLALKLKE